MNVCQRSIVPLWQINMKRSSFVAQSTKANSVSFTEQEIWANAHETRDSISLISYARCLGLFPAYFSENSL